MVRRIQAKRSRRWLRFISSALLLTVMACGAEGDEDDPQGERGGDHIPELKSYALTEMPAFALNDGLVGTEFDSPYLRRFVHLGDVFRICLPPAEFSQAEFVTLSNLLKRKQGASDDWGLEPVVNRVLATLNQFDSALGSQSARIDLRLIYEDEVEGNTTVSCDFVLANARNDGFPFNLPEFDGSDQVLAYPGQLVAIDLRTNRIPVGFVVGGSAAERAHDMQYLIASYLGLSESSTDGSYLNRDMSASTASGWFFENSDGSLRLGNDALILYGFGTAFKQVLQPSDLESFHHYEDQLNPTEPETDPLLQVMDTQTTTFTELVGDRYLTGVRTPVASLNVCFQNQAGITFDQSAQQALISWANHATEGSLLSLLAARDSGVAMQAVVATEGCHLLVALRSSAQYPFSEHPFNGRFAREGAVAGPSLPASDIPVIYMNADNLYFSGSDPLLKDAALVFRHEFAHFLGFRHSRSQTSILSPAGYNSAWDEAGEDGAMFDRWIENWRSITTP